ncbi:hypothetical protein [Xylocopilactobacillus apicola]|uniref:Major facilitator superfamily (MFS) profile domain-containing protein n=1 Tax=Xylocopilactobacillus apicola TaxID=2932184 RepID=A0AAU9DQC9_9LACO|nr:hypothetical protein [Xylocopilactobacillus apicola]BDR59397.1 hypothetical protein XA3_18380 [Xylocopilactobacillus apicola]
MIQNNQKVTGMLVGLAVITTLTINNTQWPEVSMDMRLIPLIVSFVALIAAGFLEKTTGKKNLALAALVLLAVGHLVIIAGSSSAIFLAKLTSYLAIGLLTPITLAYPFELFSPKTAEKILGLQILGYLGASIITTMFNHVIIALIILTFSFVFYSCHGSQKKA